ncbi:MAG TPA: GNAT family N-acetyltransferase [Woeseiaceae bacterium]|nr:GNAT family N-acetyltransferase [Woeseiaceae bacterium]
MIETEHLLLRRVDPERDFEPWARAMADERVVRGLGTAPMGRALAWRHMASIVGHWAIRGYGFFSVEEKASGAWVGRVGPWFPEGWPAPEIGWTLAPEHWGKGYATEAARAALDYAFRTLGWSSVVHVMLPDNARSIAVAERLGSTFLRTQRGLEGVTDREVVIYGQDAPGRSS